MNSQRRGSNFHRLKRQTARSQSKRINFSTEVITSSGINVLLASNKEIELEKSGFTTPLVVEKIEYVSDSPVSISRFGSKMSFDMKCNKTVQILEGARIGGYGILAAIAYNVEHITAYVQAAEAARSPFIILLFPSTLKQLPSLVYAARAAADSSSVPISVHVDHAQDVEQIKFMAENLPVDSIMVDMSHYDEEENLAKTKVLGKLCHEHGIAVEAESGRINGGEDGIADTGDLEGLLTSPNDVEKFISADIDILAPSIGNIHGDYGPKGPHLDLQRLNDIASQCKGRVQIALHGTNDFSYELLKTCIKAGTNKLNVNKLVLDNWDKFIKANVNKLSLTSLMDEGIALLQKEMEKWMIVAGSAGKA